MSTVTRDFKMHPQLLRDVIKRQAGSLEKAIVEGVMNAIEAGSGEVRVVIKADEVEIIDTGKGFAAIDEIERYFEVFGAPHTEDENKIWANFRMGRGQMFSFGVNRWRTANYLLTVDIDNKGLNYDIEELPEYYSGCHITIELYKSLYSYDLYSIKEALKLQLKYSPVPVFVNDECISCDPAQQEWTVETEDAYIDIDSSNVLTVYNMGIYVRNFYAGSSFGVGGTVVSKHQLQVNFARNDVQSTCESWQRISATLNKIAGDSFTGNRDYNDAEVERIATLLRTNQYINPSVADAKIIKAVTGRKYSLKQIVKNAYKYKNITAADEGNRIGDVLHRSEIAFVVATSTLRLFRVDTIDELLECWQKNSNFYKYTDKLLDMCASFESLTAGYNDDYDTIATEDCSRTVQAWLEVARCLVYPLSIDADGRWQRPRKVICGKSAVAAAWTDGATFVAYDYEFLTDLPLSLQGVVRLAMVTLHELQHDEPDTVSHAHDQTFYENFHDAAQTVKFAKALATAFAKFPKILKSFNLAVAKAEQMENMAIAGNSVNSEE